jgi:hypothetical protein
MRKSWSCSAALVRPMEIKMYFSRTSPLLISATEQSMRRVMGPNGLPEAKRINLNLTGTRV